MNQLESSHVAKVINHLNELGRDADLLAREAECLADTLRILQAITGILGLQWTFSAMTTPRLLGSLVFGAIAAKQAHLSDSAIIYRALYHVLVLGIGFEFVEETIFGPSYFFLFAVFSFYFLRHLFFIWVILANSVLVCHFESWVEQWYLKVSPLAKAEEILVILIFLVASVISLAVNAEADGDIRDDALWILLIDFQLFLLFLLIDLLFFLFGVFLLL